MERTRQEIVLRKWHQINTSLEKTLMSTAKVQAARCGDENITKKTPRPKNEGVIENLVSKRKNPLERH